MSLPEIAEARAEGRTADIYGAILEATGLPSTNLVWRHMATFPGALEWAYGALEDAFTGGAFRILGADLAAAAAPAEMEPLGPDDGLDPATVESAASVMAFYNRANPINLIAIHALRRVLAGDTSPSGGAALPPASPAPRLPTLPAPAREIDSLTAARMESLARTVNGNAGALMLTALRHLANWPAAIAALHPRVQSLAAGGVLDDRAAALRRAAVERAGRLALAAPAVGAPADEARRALEPVIDLFVPLIARMIVIGRSFGAALAAARLR